ncbi:MAG: serine O-acetyltransferase EpsC [Bacteroidota bacterium]
MDKAFIVSLYHAHRKAPLVPSSDEACKVINGLLEILFPELAEQHYTSLREFEQRVSELRYRLHKVLLKLSLPPQLSADIVEDELAARLPVVREWLLADAEAIYQFDPAANSVLEVKRVYLGFYAIAVYRIAHELHKIGVPLLPRILTEYAHSKTGIEIHPAAQIGRNFFIDHGTGVVIGATCIIGNDVKIYQGVTLGALSVSKDLATTKRHPTIEDGVIIYAGATILGGDTIIGHHSIIGGNVWVTKSVAPYSQLYHRALIKRISKQEDTTP